MKLIIKTLRSFYLSGMEFTIKALKSLYPSTEVVDELFANTLPLLGYELVMVGHKQSSSGSDTANDHNNNAHTHHMA